MDKTTKKSKNVNFINNTNPFLKYKDNVEVQHYESITIFNDFKKLKNGKLFKMFFGHNITLDIKIYEDKKSIVLKFDENLSGKILSKMLASFYNFKRFLTYEEFECPIMIINCFNNKRQDETILPWNSKISAEVFIKYIGEILNIIFADDSN